MTCQNILKVLFQTAGALLIIAGLSSAQISVPMNPKSTPTSSWAKYVSIRGELGLFGEQYSSSGNGQNRPPQTGRIFFKPQLSLFNTITVNFNIFLSNEGSAARQQINQIDINPKWAWGEIHAMDFTDSYSPHTLSGIKIRGGEVKLFPGAFRFSILNGRTQRSTSGANGLSSFNRQIQGGSIGVGSQTGSSVDLIVLYLKDDLSVIPDSSTDSSSQQDTSFFQDTQNPLSITPSENLVASLVSKLSFADDRLSLKNEISGSAFTRDRKSAELQLKGYPSFLKSIFTPRIGSNVDYAYASEANLKLNPYGFRAGYQYIGPGYVSLGLASFAPDRRVIKFGINRRIKQGVIKFDYNHQNDNLIKQKSYTSNRNSFTGGLGIKPLMILNSNLNITYLTMKNDANDSSSAVDYANWIFQLNNTLGFNRRTGIKNISIDYTYQTADDKNPARASSALDSHTAGFRLVYGINDSWDFGPSVNYILSKQGGTKRIITQNYSITSRLLSFSRKLNSNGKIGFTISDKATSVQSSLREAYEIRPLSTFTLQLEVNIFRSQDHSKNFNDLTTRAILSQRF